MFGYLFISPTPYAALSDETGALVIRQLPIGRHTFVVWHAPRFVKKLSREETAIVLKRGGRLDIDIKKGETELGTFGIR